MLINNNFDMKNPTLGDLSEASNVLREYTNAFAAIEELMMPASESGEDDLKMVSRYALSSLIRVVNNGLLRHIEETDDVLLKLLIQEQDRVRCISE